MYYFEVGLAFSLSKRWWSRRIIHARAGKGQNSQGRYVITNTRQVCYTTVYARQTTMVQEFVIFCSPTTIRQSCTSMRTWAKHGYDWSFGPRWLYTVWSTTNGQNIWLPTIPLVKPVTGHCHTTEVNSLCRDACLQSIRQTTFKVTHYADAMHQAQQGNMIWVLGPY